MEGSMMAMPPDVCSAIRQAGRPLATAGCEGREGMGGAEWRESKVGEVSDT